MERRLISFDVWFDEETSKHVGKETKEAWVADLDVKEAELWSKEGTVASQTVQGTHPQPSDGERTSANWPLEIGHSTLAVGPAKYCSCVRRCFVARFKAHLWLSPLQTRSEHTTIPILHEWDGRQWST